MCSETPLEMDFGREMDSLHSNCTLLQNLRHLWHYAVIKLHILEWPFIVASLRHICAIITNLDRFVNNTYLREIA